MENEKTYTTREICRGLDIPERTLIHWADKGLVEPVVDADGLGTRRQYTAHNVFEIAIIKALWKRVSNKAIKACLIALDLVKNEPERGEFLFIDGRGVKPMSLDELIKGKWPATTLRERLEEEELVTLLNVKKIRDQVQNFLNQ